MFAVAYVIFLSFDRFANRIPKQYTEADPKVLYQTATSSVKVMPPRDPASSNGGLVRSNGNTRGDHTKVCSFLHEYCQSDNIYYPYNEIKLALSVIFQVIEQFE